jgi:hypothetical protein
MFGMRSSILISCFATLIACFATAFVNTQSLTKQEGDVARLIDQDAPAAIEVLEGLSTSTPVRIIPAV